MKKNMVSILTPAYNTSKYIHRLLDSVLDQTYPDIEMIIVDDGSNDGLAVILEPYLELFTNRGYKLEYICQPNSGQSVAIHNGLKHINGEYLTWPDSDDYYSSPDSIERLVEGLETASDEYGMVRCQSHLIDECSGNVLKLFGGNRDEFESFQLFEDCLLDRNGFYFPPGAYMIKTEALKKSSKFPIYTSHEAGQNWQLMLPILYHYRCRTIPKPLFNVLNRSDSHSRSQLKYQNFRERRIVFKTTILETLNRIRDITETDLIHYSKLVQVKYSYLLWDYAIKFQQREDELIEYRCLKKLNVLTMKQCIIHILFKYRLTLFYRIYSKIKQLRHAH